MGHACFASHGGIFGTTSLLRDWHVALATCINGGGAKPTLASLVHRFLETPEIVSTDDVHGEIANTVFQGTSDLEGKDATGRADGYTPDDSPAASPSTPPSETPLRDDKEASEEERRKELRPEAIGMRDEEIF